MSDEKKPIIQNGTVGKEDNNNKSDANAGSREGNNETEDLDEGCSTRSQGTGIRLLICAISMTWILADCTVDWLFYKNLLNIKRGLVLGPVSVHIQSSMLVFCCIGTAISTLSFVNVVCKGICFQAMVRQETLFLVTVWCKNFPQIVISNVIAACQEVAVTYYQVIKAVMMITAVIAMAVILVVLCFVQSTRKSEEKTRRPTWQLVMIYFGVVINLACASSVLCMVHISPVDEYGSIITFKTPKGDIDMSRYFDEIDIFFHHPNFEENCLKVNRSSSNYWLRIGSIFEVADTGLHGLRVIYNHKTEPNKTYFYVHRSYSKLLSEKNCYILDKQKCLIYHQTHCTDNFINNTRTAIMMTFQYVLPTTRRLFGDVKYDAYTYNTSDKRLRPPPCMELVTTINKLKSNFTKINRLFGRLHYFENVLMRPGMKPRGIKPLQENGNATRFYEYSALLDAKKIWRTGVAKCHTTGNLGPIPMKFLRCL